MIRNFSFVILTLLISTSLKAEVQHSPLQLNQMAHACFLINADSPTKTKCLSNVHQLTKQAINSTLEKIGQRDKVHTLNTKALELTLQQQQCPSLNLSKLSTIDCHLTTEIALLNYINDRYEANN